MIGFDMFLSDGIAPQKMMIAEGRFLACETTKAKDTTGQGLTLLLLCKNKIGGIQNDRKPQCDKSQCNLCF